uniref:C3H1-type domain-containing protein n=1 Tax=Lotharella globosa TaxID=91324 RepID=A0A6V3NUZ4_9EUKA
MGDPRVLDSPDWIDTDHWVNAILLDAQELRKRESSTYVFIPLSKQKLQSPAAKGSMRQEIKDSKNGTSKNRRNDETISTAPSTDTLQADTLQALFPLPKIWSVMSNAMANRLSLWCKAGKLSSSHSSCALDAGVQPSSGVCAPSHKKHSERCRLALIIANWEYEGDRVMNLRTPEQDQKIIKCALEANGFEASLRTNLTAQRLKNEIGNFVEKVMRMNSRVKVEAILFYFAGHGMSDSNGHLHLCGVDASSDCNQGILKLRYIREQFKEMAGSLKIAVLDCCRISTTSPKGIIALELDFPAVYSTKPFERAFDRVTDDGLQKAVSPFAGSFARNLVDKRNRTIGDAIHKTCEDIRSFTSGTQTPQVDSKHLEDLDQLLLHGSITKPSQQKSTGSYHTLGHKKQTSRVISMERQSNVTAETKEYLLEECPIKTHAEGFLVETPFPNGHLVESNSLCERLLSFTMKNYSGDKDFIQYMENFIPFALVVARPRCYFHYRRPPQKWCPQFVRHKTCRFKYKCHFAHHFLELQPMPCVANERCRDGFCPYIHTREAKTTFPTQLRQIYSMLRLRESPRSSRPKTRKWRKYISSPSRNKPATAVRLNCRPLGGQKISQGHVHPRSSGPSTCSSRSSSRTHVNSPKPDLQPTVGNPFKKHSFIRRLLIERQSSMLEHVGCSRL